MDQLKTPSEWVQCESCDKWRLLPYGMKVDHFPDKWFCSMLNWLPGMNSCDVSEDDTKAALVQYQPVVPLPKSNCLQNLVDQITTVASFGHRANKMDQLKTPSFDHMPNNQNVKDEKKDIACSQACENVEEWVQCESCDKWRLLPYGIMADQLPDKWFCSMLNWLPGMNSCDVSEDDTNAALVQYQPVVPLPKSNCLQNQVDQITTVASFGHRANKMDQLKTPSDWVQCESCEKWRLLPYGFDVDQLPLKWVCSMLNWLPGKNSCDVSEDDTTNAARLVVPLPKSNSFQNQVDHQITTVAPAGLPSFNQTPGIDTMLNRGKKRHIQKIS